MGRNQTQLAVGGFLQVANYVSPSILEKWKAYIFANQSRWITREFFGHPPFYSFGRSWYLDIEAGDLHVYHREAEATNRFINKMPKYMDVMRSTAQFLPSPSGKNKLPLRSRSENLGPYWVHSGLHIIGGRHQFRRPEAGRGALHADYEGLAPYPSALFDRRTRAFSAIVSVVTPKSGGGLDVLTAKRYFADEPEPQDPIDHRQCRHLEYSPGALTILDSFLFHRIQGSVFTPKSPWRITAVIHFLYRSKPYPHWEYWF